jgi:hypothetical protein
LPVSVLSSLEPLFGASLAINLAYLNLNTFRYRDKMAEEARQKLTNAPATVKDTKWYREIKSLADQPKAGYTKLDLPRAAVWSHLYRCFFHWRIDNVVSIILTATSAFYLFMGVAYSVKLFGDQAWLLGDQTWASEPEIVNELAYATAGLFWPMLMVLIAKFCTYRCSRFVKYQMDDLAEKVRTEGAKDVTEASQELKNATAKISSD